MKCMKGYGVQMFDKTQIFNESYVKGEELHIDIWYPRNYDSKIKAFVIGLMDVRAADSIRVAYDFNRDGWKIEQATKFEWAIGEDPDPGWKEVSFIQAWHLKENSNV